MALELKHIDDQIAECTERMARMSFGFFMYRVNRCFLLAFNSSRLLFQSTEVATMR